MGKRAKIWHDYTEAARIWKARQMPLGTTDWFYRALVPKDWRSNLEYRRVMLEMIVENPEFIEDIQCICARDILFEINTFGWIHNPIDFPDHPQQPFITRKYQDEMILKVRDAIAYKRQLGILKSREMGATWCCIVPMEHRWRYKPLQTFILSSLGAEYTNSPGGMKGLLQKVEWYTQQLPVFLKPRGEVRAITSNGKYTNPDNLSVFTAEAQTDTLGTSDRATAILLDEAAKMTKARRIFTSTLSTAYCRIFNSTPYGMADNAFADQIKHPALDKFCMHWSDDRIKRKGLYYISENGKKKRFPKGWKWQDSYDFDLWTFKEPKPRSTWYDQQVANAAGDMESIAQELDLNFNKVGKAFIPEHKIAAWRSTMSLAPTHWGNLSVHPESLEQVWYEADGVPWSIDNDELFLLWLILDEMKRPPRSDYSVGCDTAQGTGGEHSSPSSLVVIDQIAKRMVARFTTRRMQPPSFARFSVGVCKWFWDAKLCHETNGPGKNFSKTLIDNNLYWNYYLRKTEMLGSQHDTTTIGWNSSPAEGPKLIMEQLRDAIELKRIVIPDAEVFKEMGEYHYLQNGKITHPKAKTRDFNGNDGITHGDIAVAAALAYECMAKDADSPAAEKKKPFAPNSGNRPIDLFEMARQQLLQRSPDVESMFSGYR